MSDKEKIKRVLFMLRLFLIVILSLWLLVFVVHKLLTASEKKKLAAEGFYNPVSVGDYDLNVYLYGNENGKHTIVGLSGMGVNTYSVNLKAVTDRFAANNRIAVVDRAGYGMSDSTNVPQTVEQVVEDYRTALKNAGCEAPYILLPHSLGNMFATYWQSVYPDEVEGMLILEGTLPDGDITPFDDMFNPSSHELLLTAVCNTGLQRVFHDAIKGEMSWRNLTMQQQKFAQAMEMHSTYTFAQHSESELFNENQRTVWNTIQKTDIPKIYVTCQPDSTDEVIEYLEYRNETYRWAGKEPPYDLSDTNMIDRLTDNFVESNVSRNLSISNYMYAIGSCTVKHVAGIHNIYKQKPNEIAALLAELIETIDQ